MPNLFDPEFDAERDDGRFRWRRARLGRQAGSDQLGASLFELPPGAASFPLHAHYANEELLLVLEGAPTLRTIDAERQLERGEVVACPAGRRGAHELRNESEASVRVLIVSTMRAPDINEFPDSGEFWVRDYAPGTDAPDGALDRYLESRD
jgi:uncharacterized cupin superfamily protein